MLDDEATDEVRQEVIKDTDEHAHKCGDEEDEERVHACGLR